MCKESLWLGGIQELAVKDAVVEWLLAESVAGEDQFFLMRVPQSDREHSIQVLYKRVAVFFIQVRDDLGVRLRDKSVAFRLELTSHAAIVVQLAILHGDHALVFVEYRLVARGEIDDREPSHSESDVRVHPDPFRIGTSM